jgi:hypothetical protein
MAYDNSGLKRIGSQGGATLWHYTSSSDNLATMDTNGYFGANTKDTVRAADRLKVGDIIFGVGSGPTYGILVVNANSRDISASPPVIGQVDTTSTTTIGSADSD